jgi:hypothetical protein
MNWRIGSRSRVLLDLLYAKYSTRRNITEQGSERPNYSMILPVHSVTIFNLHSRGYAVLGREASAYGIGVTRSKSDWLIQYF